MVSYAGVVANKRGGDHIPVKRVGTFRPNKDYIKLLEQNVLRGGFGCTRPKSMYKHGIRIFFGDVDPMLVREVGDAASKVFVNHTHARSSLEKGFFDMAFASKLEADEAAKVILKVNGKLIPTARTRYNEDGFLFIGFDRLPCVLTRASTQEMLLEGLKAYGEVQDFELQTDPIFPNSGASKGFAIIKPYQNTRDAWDKIPRKACFEDQEGNQSSSFRVFPERVTPQCKKCHAIGHMAANCPNLLERVKKAAADPDAMEEFDGDDWIESIEEEEVVEEVFVWGEQADYDRVEPMTYAQRKELSEIKRREKEQKSEEKIEIEEKEEIGAEQVIVKEILPIPETLPKNQVTAYEYEKANNNKKSKQQKQTSKTNKPSETTVNSRPRRDVKEAGMEKSREALLPRAKAPNGSKNGMAKSDEEVIKGKMSPVYISRSHSVFPPREDPSFEDRHSHQGMNGTQC